MFIVADQRPVRVSGECCLARSRQTEKDGCVTGVADICGTMHRHDAFRRQKVVQHCEHRLFHLTGVGRSADEDDLSGQVAGDDRFASASVPRGIGFEARQIYDRHFRREGSKLRSLWPQQQVADEQGVPGILCIDPHRQAVLWIRSAIQVLCKQLETFRMLQEIVQKDIELRL